MTDTPNRVKYGRSSGISTVERAFGCPDCGNTMGVKTSGTAKLYCPRPCCNEVSINEMTPEQRFYVSVAREKDDIGIRPKEAVIEWLESGGWK